MAVQSNTPGQLFPYYRRRLVRGVLRRGIAAIFTAFTHFDITGKDNLPETGPLLVVANHFHFLDPLAVIHCMPYPMEFIGGRQAPNAPGTVSWIRNLWGVLPVSRGASSRDSLLRAQHFLENQGVLGIFPEGGSWAAVLRPARPGAALLAARSGARILPVGLDGLIDVLPRLRRSRRATVHINIGKPFGPFILDANARANRQQMDAIGDEIMRHIAELLPPDRRGYYSDDPTIRAAAKGTEIYPWDNAQEK